MANDPEELAEPNRPSLRDKARAALRRFTQQQHFDLTQDPSQQPQPEVATRPTAAPVETTQETPLDREQQALHVELPDKVGTDYSGYTTAINAATPAPAPFNAKADNEILAGMGPPQPEVDVAPIVFQYPGGQQQPAAEARIDQTEAQPAAAQQQHPPLVDQTPAADIVRRQVQTDEAKAAHEVTEDRRVPEPPQPPDQPLPELPQTQRGQDLTGPEPRELSGREGQAASSARFAALRPEAKTDAAADLDAWAAAQIPDVARQHFEMWREANEAAVHAVDHMQANVPDHSQDVETRLTGLAVEVRHGFHQARTGLDLIENPTPATLSAFMANAHHENTPDLLKTATPEEVPAIVIADSAALNADLGDSIDALDAAISNLAHEEAARAPVGASVITPANDSAAAPIVRDERPTFQDLTDARLDDINAILDEARSNDNRPGAPVATVLTAAAAQTLHRISELDGIEAGTPEHEQAVEVTRDEISSLIANVADAREVHVTESDFAGVVAQDETALAAMLALSSPAAEGSSQEASPDDARHLADFEALTGEMTDAKWSRADAKALAQMEEMSDYKAEATEKNASRARNSTERGGGMDR